MKLVALLVTALAITSTAFAYEDVYGHRYKNPENLYNDRDGDGVIGMYDRNDSNRYKTY